MSNSSIEGRLKGLQERFENEMRIRRDSNNHNQGGLQASRPGSGRRPKPLFSNQEIPAYPPRSPQATETESRMREVYKVSGKLNVDGVEYRSHIDELQHLGELGSGTCGHVVKMLHKPSGAVIAVKQMRRSGNSEEIKRILMDLYVVVRSHDCPYIVRCLGCFVTDADVWICMELMASCFDKLLKRLGAPIPEEILGKVTVATVNALSYLKDTHGVIHRDVKPSNILLDERGNVKLCDFGISGRLVDSKAKTRSAGCAAYMAPERIDPPDPTRPDYDIRADVWSLGISLVELATGVFPYRDCTNDFEVLTRVIADDPPQLPEDSNFSPEFKSFVSQCLTKNYRQRPKYVKLLEHPFVVKSARSSVSVGAWYASLPLSGQSTPNKSVATHAPHVSSANGVEAPLTPQPVRNFVTSLQHWTPDQVTPTPSRRSRSPVPPSTGVKSVTTHAPHVSSANGVEAPLTPQPVRNFVTSSQHWTPDQVTPTPSRRSRSPVPPSTAVKSVPTHAPHVSSANGVEAPLTPQPVRNFVTSLQHWTPDQVTPTPSRRSRSPVPQSTGVKSVTTHAPHVSSANGVEAPLTPVRNFVTSSQHWTPDQVTPTPSRRSRSPVPQSTGVKSVTSNHAPHVSSANSVEAPLTPQPVRNFVTSSQHWTPDQVTPTPSRHSRSPIFGNRTPQPVRNFVTSSHHWMPEQVTPTPSRAWWASSNASAGGSSSQPTSLELELGTSSPFGRRRTLDVCASPPPPPARRVSADNRWRASPNSSGNTSPIVLQRFQHQSNQRRSRVDLHSTPRHRSLSKEHSTGRSPEPPPRMSRQHHMLGHEANGSMELEPPALHERLHPPSPLLLHERLQEGRSQSLTRAELRNGFRTEITPPAPPPKHHHDDQGWLHSLAGLVKRRLSGYVKWHHVAARERPAAHANNQPLHHPHHGRHRWNTSESWSVPASPLPPRAPPPRPAD